MAIRGAIPMDHGDVFPHGCYVVSEVTPQRDFDRSTQEQAVQATDKESGEPVWLVEVLDGDLEARDKTVRVKVSARVQPVPPEATAPGVPFRPVEFEGLTATPYVQTTAFGRGKLAWSFRATGMHAPKAAAVGARNGKTE